MDHWICACARCWLTFDKARHRPIAGRPGSFSIDKRRFATFAIVRCPNSPRQLLQLFHVLALPLVALHLELLCRTASIR